MRHQRYFNRGVVGVRGNRLMDSWTAKARHLMTDLHRLSLNAFGISSLRKRIVVFLTAGILGCSVLMAAVSYNAINTMQQNKIKTSMSFDLYQQSMKLAQIYNNLLQVTQQMTPEGNVGHLMESYSSTGDSYSRYLLKLNISYNIGLITFSNPAMELAMYYSPADKQAAYSNLPLREDFKMGSLLNVAGYADIQYQPPHLSLCRFSDDQVVSVTREIAFSDGSRKVIYVEAKSDIATDIDALSRSVNMPYVLVLTNREGEVQYSSNQGIFSPGRNLILNGTSGTTDGYLWNRAESDYGYGMTLLLPVASYNHELYAWKNHMVLILGIALMVMFSIALLLLRLINRPLRMFESEMEALGQGHMDAMPYRTGISEFDRLFDQFDKMKQQIQQLIVDVEQKEKRRHQLEIEKLAYQINPHFLMNALNSVRWLAVMHQQADIDKFVSSLIFLLHYNLGKSQETATLRTETKVMRAYLDLQQMRYDFEVKLDLVEGSYLDCPVARFILQPIVENAVCHGLDEHGKLDISISPDDTAQIARIVIRDDGKGLSREMLALLQRETPDPRQMGRGIGLRYVRSMLQSFYGDRARLHIDSTPRQGTTVTMHLPYGKENPM
ncbi:sensor histidine kinase [Cohnella nanjingensis]|uniref:histidine kinase n=1 Tax=Cohnella nanjingensis TaxID=1387779 RepID=A0A7X0RRP8_9BACL|nr:histidine kinase [Cohnella nanjingensis]MBB6672238.1 histidine kinase [Cohnella nanjingensis]